MLKEALFGANFQALYPRFLNRNIDFKLAKNLSEISQLSSPNVETIGQRHILRIALIDSAAAKHQGKY